MKHQLAACRRGVYAIREALKTGTVLFQLLNQVVRPSSLELPLVARSGH